MSPSVHKLYLFCTVSGFVRSKGLRGHYIKTGAGGIQRRRKGLPRGSTVAPQGRPPKRKSSLNDIPLKTKRLKRHHNLSKNIALGDMNA